MVQRRGWGRPGRLWLGSKSCLPPQGGRAPPTESAAALRLQDIVMGRPRDGEDRVSWFLEKKRFEDALALIEHGEAFKDSTRERVAQVPPPPPSAASGARALLTGVSLAGLLGAPAGRLQV